MIDSEKRKKYLHLLKIRAFCSQAHTIEDIYTFQHNKTFPWMIFKIVYNNTDHIMEIDCIEGFLKVTDTNKLSTILLIRMRDFNGAFELFEDEQIQVSYIYYKRDLSFVFKAKHSGQTELIVQFLQFFADFQARFLDSRKLNYLGKEKLTERVKVQFYRTFLSFFVKPAKKSLFEDFTMKYF